MTLSVGNKLRSDIFYAELFKRSDNFFYQFKVGKLVICTDVVYLPCSAVFKYQLNGFAVVFDVYPVADVLSVTVNRYLFAADSFFHCKRDKLFGVLAFTVVV